MSLSSVVSLGALRIQARQRADMENSQFVTDAEFNQYISQSYKELYDLLVAAYGNDYFVQTPYQFNLNGSQYYPLPADFYKLLGVDLFYTGSPNGWVSLRRYEFIERNKDAYPNSAGTFLGRTNLKYRLVGSQLAFIPIPSSNQQIQVWYIPEPTSISFFPTCSTTISSTSITISDTTNIVAGMSIYGSGIPLNTTIISVNTTAGTAVISNAATLTQPVIALNAWIDSATLDGISGWEEYIIVDAAIKAMIKEESDISGLSMQLEKMKERIESMSEGRDAGQAHHVSDVMSINQFDGFDGGADWGCY